MHKKVWTEKTRTPAKLKTQTKKNNKIPGGNNVTIQSP